MTPTLQPPRLSEAALSGLISGVINGSIAWSGFRDGGPVPMSMDSIGEPGITALGNAISVAFSLSFILSCINFLMFRAKARKNPAAPAALRELPFFWTGLKLALMNLWLVFGAFVSIAVLWQRFVGTVFLAPVTATLVVGLIAAVTSAVVAMRTQRQMLLAGA